MTRHRWDWAGLVRPRPLAARAVALLGFAVVAAWRGAPAVLPATLAFPLAEALVAWHGGQAAHALTRYADRPALARHLRVLGRRTLLALVPPLLLASALLAAAGHLPGGGSPARVTATRASVGLLCAIGYGLVLLLAAARRLRYAVVLAGLAVLATVLWPVAVLAVFLAGIVLAAVALFDPRRVSHVTAAAAPR